MDHKIIITIGRQFGSGGKDIGKKLSEQLSIPFYDKELIGMAAKKSGICSELLENIDEKATSSLLYSLSMGIYPIGGAVNATTAMPMNDQLFLLQADIIRGFASEGSCIIVGRCADYILKDDPNCAKIFIHAPLEERIATVATRYDLTPKKAEDMVVKTDKRRANYYNFYSGKKWGNLSNYDLCINSKLGADNVMELISSFVRLKQASLSK